MITEVRLPVEMLLVLVYIVRDGFALSMFSTRIRRIIFFIIFILRSFKRLTDHIFPDRIMTLILINTTKRKV